MSLAALVAAVLLRSLVDPFMGDALPVVTLFGAVAAAVWVSGSAAAAVVAVLGYLACAYLFIEPRGTIVLADVGVVVGIVAYVFACALIIGFGEMMRTAQRSAVERQETLRITLRSIGDAVIATDARRGHLHEPAWRRTLTGWARGRTLTAARSPRSSGSSDEGTRRPSTTRRSGRCARAASSASRTTRCSSAKDGAERAIDDSAAPIRDARGEVSGCVLVSPRRRGERRSERETAAQLLGARLLASIVESSEGRDHQVNRSTGVIQELGTPRRERLFGHPAEKAVGRHISLVIPPERDRRGRRDHREPEGRQTNRTFRDRSGCAPTGDAFGCRSRSPPCATTTAK